MTITTDPTTRPATTERAAVLKRLQSCICYTRRTRTHESAVMSMVTRYGSACRLAAWASTDLERTLADRASHRRFDAVQRLVYAEQGGAR